MQKAVLWEKCEDGKVHCFLCGHQCRIPSGGFGICGVRQNSQGELLTLAYGRVIAASVDPIEKKPLYHFLPGTTSYSVATAGCNFRCGFCQNWQISQRGSRKGPGAEGVPMTPEQIVKGALENGCRSISYTYTEPTIFFEYALDTARIARQQGLANVFVTNGYMTPQAVSMARPYLDAANIDLKSFRDEFYRTVCGGTLEPVLESIRLMHSLGIWIEVTTLVVPGGNDTPEELADIAHFLAGVDTKIPWHISRFYPNYKIGDREPTPEKILQEARRLGQAAGLDYVYVGNVYGWGNDTECASCRKLLVKREAYTIRENNIAAGKCRFCGSDIPGRF
jgi:pyruvate formate lyase activating enzyme